jgi:tetratricopeptide (TPR) repeat protein
MPLSWLSVIPAAARWVWSKIRRRPTAHADRGAVAAGRDQTISGAVVTGDRPGPVIVAQPGATVNVYYDGLPQAEPKVRDPFQEGRRLQEAGQHETAIAQFEKALALADNDSQRCALHILIGNSFIDLSRFPEAEGHYGEGLVLARRASDTQGQGAAFTGLGNVCLLRGGPGDLDKAEQHHKRALAISRKMRNPLGEAQDLANLGMVYFQRGQPGDLGRAEQHFKKALRISTEIGSSLGQAIVLGNLGLVYVRQGELDKAGDRFEKALAIHEEIGNRLGQAQQLGNLGLLQAQRGNAPLALDRLGRARDLFAQVGARAELEKTIANIKALERARPPKPKRKRPRNKPPRTKP